MILDSPYNIRINKKGHSGQEVLFEHCAWSSYPSKISINLFQVSVVWGIFRMPKLRTAVRVFPPSSTRLIQHSYFCTEMGDRMMKQLHWACTATGVHSSENLLFFWLFWNWQCSHFLFLGGHTHSGQAKVTFGRIWHNSLLTAAQYGLCNDSDHGKQKKHGLSLPVKDSIMGPRWPSPVISVALRVSLTRRQPGGLLVLNWRKSF